MFSLPTRVNQAFDPEKFKIHVFIGIVRLSSLLKVIPGIVTIQTGTALKANKQYRPGSIPYDIRSRKSSTYFTRKQTNYQTNLSHGTFLASKSAYIHAVSGLHGIIGPGPNSIQTMQCGKSTIAKLA